MRRRRERNVSKLAELPQVLSKLIAARFKASRLLEVGLASEAGPTFPSIGPIAVPFARTLQGSLHSGENPGNYSPARCLLTGYGHFHYTRGLELRNRRLPLHRVFKTPTFSKERRPLIRGGMTSGRLAIRRNSVPQGGMAQAYNVSRLCDVKLRISD